MARLKVKSRSYHECTPKPQINGFIKYQHVHFTVSEIQPERFSISRSKATSRLHYDVAHMHPSEQYLIKYQHPTF